MVDDEHGGFENAGGDDLQLDAVGEGRGGAKLVLLGVGFAHGVHELAPDGHPFRGFEVVVLEEDEERGGAQERGVLSVELRFALFGPSVGGWLVVWVADDGGSEGRWVERRCWGDGWSFCRGCVFGEALGLQASGRERMKTMRADTWSRRHYVLGKVWRTLGLVDVLFDLEVNANSHLAAFPNVKFIFTSPVRR